MVDRIGVLIGLEPRDGDLRRCGGSTPSSIALDWCGIGNRNVPAKYVRLRALGVRFPPFPHGRVSI